jgi:hypothetical protein
VAEKHIALGRRALASGGLRTRRFCSADSTGSSKENDSSKNGKNALHGAYLD